MADELDPVELEFRGEMADLLAEMDDLVHEARDLAGVTRDAQDALSGERDTAAETSGAVNELRSVTSDLTDAEAEADAGAHELKDSLDSVRDSSAGAGEAIGHVRDEAAEAAAAMGIYRDAAGRMRDETGRFVSASEIEALGLGHLRDESLEAAAAVKELGDSADQTAAKLDLMGLAGLSSYSGMVPLLGMIGALVIAAAAVAPAAAAMGLGFAGFGVMAMPAIMQVTQGLSQISQAQQAVQNATTATARSSALKQLHQDWANMPAPIADTVRELLAFKTEFFSLANSSGITGDVLGDITKVLGIARELLPVVIPLARQGAIAFSDMLGSISKGIDSSGFRSFMTTMTAMVVPATAAIGHLAGVVLGLLGHALTSLAPLSIPFIGFLTVLVSALSGPVVAALHVIISLFLGLAKAIEPLLPGISAIATAIITDLGGSFGAVVPLIQQVIQILGGALLKILTDLLPIIENFLTPNSPFITALGIIPILLRVILPLFTTLASILANPFFARVAVDVISAMIAFRALVAVLGLVRGAFALLTAVMEVNPVILILTGIALLVVAFAELWQHSAAFRNFWIDLWHDITTAFDAAIQWIEGHWKLLPAILLGPLGILVTEILLHWQFIEHIFEDAWNHIKGIVVPAANFIAGYIRVNFDLIAGIAKGAWDQIVGVFRAAWDIIRGVVSIAIDVIKGDIEFSFDLIRGIVLTVMDLIEGHWSAAWHEMQSTAGQLLGAIKNTIMNGVADFGNLLWNAGAALVRGLIGGIESMIGSVGSVVGGLAHKVAGFFGLSPAIEGPLSGGGAPYIRGLHFAADIAAGIMAGHAQVAAAVAQTAALAAGVHPAAGAALGAAGLTGAALARGGATSAAPVSITIPMTVQGMMTPQALHEFQQVMQEAALRYVLNNQGSGMFLHGKLS